MSERSLYLPRLMPGSIFTCAGGYRMVLGGLGLEYDLRILIYFDLARQTMGVAENQDERSRCEKAADFRRPSIG